HQPKTSDAYAMPTQPTRKHSKKLPWQPPQIERYTLKVETRFDRVSFFNNPIVFYYEFSHQKMGQTRRSKPKWFTVWWQAIELDRRRSRYLRYCTIGQPPCRD